MRGGARPGAGRKPVEAKKVRLSLYVKPETLDHYRALRVNDIPIGDRLAFEIDVQYDAMKAGLL